MRTSAAIVVLALACGARSRHVVVHDEDASTSTDCEDTDGDGHDAADCGGDDCDDANAAIHPGADDDILASWTEEVVDSGREPVSVGVGTDGVCHVAYRDQGGSIDYSTNATGAWAVAPGPTMRADELSLDVLDGQARIAFTGSGSATYTEAAAWSAEVLGRALAGTAPSLVSTWWREHVCFVGDWDSDFPDIQWASRTSADDAWQIETLVWSVSVGKDWASPGCDLAADDCGYDWCTYVHMAFTNGATGGIGYGLFRELGMWTVEDVVDSGWAASIAIDLAGGGRLPRIFYLSADGLRVVSRAPDETWTDDLADAEAPALRETSAANGPHAQVAYAGADLRWGEWTGADFAPEIVVADREVWSISLAVDPDGVPWIGFADADHGVVVAHRTADGDGIDQDCDGVDG